MPRYQKGTAGKLIVQDWNVITSYTDTPVLRQITLRQMAALVALSEFLGWRTRYLNAPDQDTIDAFEGDTRKNLMVDVQICALVIGCITDDDDVREALNQWFVDQMSNYNSTVYQAVSDAYSPFTGGLPLPAPVRERNLLPEITGCDKDVLFGAISTLIDSMHTNNVDSFEIAETAANLAERAALVLGAIPVLETLPVDEAVDYLQTIWTDDLFEAYNANDTTAYRDTLKCDLLCIAYSAGCRLSIDDVYQYFIGRIAGDAADTFAELIAYLTTGTWVGTEINDMFFAGQLLVMYFGNRYFSIVGIRPFQQYMEIGSRSPNSTWETVCEECPDVWNYEFDFQIDEQGWQPYENYAQYVTSTGWYEDDPGIIWIYITIPDSGRIITRVDFVVATGNQVLAQVGTPADGSVGFVTDVNSAGYNFATVDLVGVTGFTTPITEIAVRVAVDGFVPVTGAIVAITLNGEGVNPFS